MESSQAAMPKVCRDKATAAEESECHLCAIGLVSAAIRQQDDGTVSEAFHKDVTFVSMHHAGVL